MKGQQSVLPYVVCLIVMVTLNTAELTMEERFCNCSETTSSTMFYTTTKPQANITPKESGNTTVKSPTTTPTTTQKAASTTTPTSTPTTTPTSTPTTTPTSTPTTTQKATPITTQKATPITTQKATPTTTPTSTPTTTQKATPTTTQKATPITTQKATPTTTQTSTPTTTPTSTPITTPTSTPTTTPTSIPTTTQKATPITTQKATPITTPAITSTTTQQTRKQSTNTPIKLETSSKTTAKSTIKSLTTKKTGVGSRSSKLNCDVVCSKYPKKKESKYPTPQPIWDFSNVSIPLSIYVEGSFSQTTLSNKSSPQYTLCSGKFLTALEAIYKEVTGFKAVIITGFSAGSIKCDFVVKMTSDKSVDPYSQYNELREVSFANFQVEIGNTTLKIELNKTESAINMKTAAYFSKACTCSTYTACQYNGSQIICSHKCDVNNICSKFGDCYVDKKGTVKCRCREDSYYVYKGDTCEEKVLVFFNGKNTAIVGACAGVVVAFLLLLFIYIGARWRHKRTRKGTDEKLSDPREIQRDNYNIENVPLDGVGKTNPAYRPDQNDRHGHDDHYPADQPTTENVYEEELAYDEGRYYRVLNDPESRSKAFVYQPTNMSIPDHRTSTASKFDDLDSKPPSFYMRPEIEQRRYHEFMETEHPYSIKRPQIMRSNVNSDGYR